MGNTLFFSILDEDTRWNFTWDTVEKPIVLETPLIDFRILKYARRIILVDETSRDGGKRDMSYQIAEGHYSANLFLRAVDYDDFHNVERAIKEIYRLWSRELKETDEVNWTVKVGDFKYEQRIARWEGQCQLVAHRSGRAE